jgi:hypothetical protein
MVREVAALGVVVKMAKRKRQQVGLVDQTAVEISFLASAKNRPNKKLQTA